VVDFVVGARFEVKTNTLVSAANENREALEKLKAAAAEADRQVGGLVDGQGRITREGKAAAKAIEDTEKALGRYLARIDPAGRATKVLAEGQELLDRALKLGIISQDQHAVGMAKAKKASDDLLFTKQNLLKGHLDVNQAVRAGTGLLLGMAGGLAATTAGALADKLATELLSAAYFELRAALDSTLRVQRDVEAAMAQGKLKKEELKLSSEELRRAYDAETEGLVFLLGKMKDLDAIQRGINLLPGGAQFQWFQRWVEDQSGFTEAQRQSAETMLRATRGEYNDGARGDPRNRVNSSDYYRPPRPGARSTGPRLTGGERELLRQADAAIKAARALDEYAEASRDIIEKAEAELSGRRELTAQIELEAQLRKRHGVQYVEDNRDRIAALAQERAAAQRVADQYKATAQFIENTTEAAGAILDATLVLAFDRGEDAVKSWEGTVLSSLRQVGAELQRLAIINPILNAFGGNRPTAYGQGGLIDQIFRSLLGGSGTTGAGFDPNIGANIAHEGWRVGTPGPTRLVPKELFYGAPRAHSGLYLGPGERPVIVEDGETILNPRQLDTAGGLVRALAALAFQRDGGGDAPVINIIDQRGANAPPVEARPRRGAGGRIEVDFIVREGGRKAIGSGDWDSALQTRYGIVPVLAR
jgi:hypothetical protein